MRLVALPLMFGLLGVAAFVLVMYPSLAPPDPIVGLIATPGAFTAFALIHAHCSEIVVFGTATAVQFLVSAFVGWVVAMASLYVC